MDQKEMAKYLKLIAIIVGVFFSIFIIWFLPVTVRAEFIRNSVNDSTFLTVMGYIWLTAVPCYIALWQFFMICCRIGTDDSFCLENANGLKKMSICMLINGFAYIIFMAVYFILGMSRLYQFTGVVLLIVIVAFITLAVVCAALSHLVQKASQLQEEHNLTV